MKKLAKQIMERCDHGDIEDVRDLAERIRGSNVADDRWTWACVIEGDIKSILSEREAEIPEVEVAV